MTQPGRVLITLDAVGGVWHHAVDVARGLGKRGISSLLVGFGPAPGDEAQQEVAALDSVEMIWPGEPLDWLARDEAELGGIGPLLSRLARQHGCDLLHVNQPSQAAELDAGLCVVAASHSCLATWWEAVHGGAIPAGWRWQHERAARGMARASRMLFPTRAHAEATRRAFRRLPAMDVVPNATAPAAGAGVRQPLVLAAGRWWDEGKNGRVLDAAAGRCGWPVLMAGQLQGPHGAHWSPQHATAPGELPAQRLHELMASAAIFAAPSLYEPFGLAVLEAGMRGAALVLADIPTFRELWGGAALFAAPREPAAFAEAIDRLAADDEARAEYAARARRRALHFGPDRQIELLLGAYGRALESCGRPLQKAG